MTNVIDPDDDPFHHSTVPSRLKNTAST